MYEIKLNADLFSVLKQSRPMLSDEKQEVNSSQLHSFCQEMFLEYSLFTRHGVIEGLDLTA